MPEYAFFSLWELETSIDRVWDIICQPEQLPDWFPYVNRAEPISPGNADGVGRLTRTWWTSALPYGFVLDLRTTRVAPPHLLELEASEDLEGTGRWELSADAGTTTVRYYWTVRTVKPWMTLLAPLARPVFAWNHAIVMRSGGEGLAGLLGARLVASRSFSEESVNPATAISTTLGLAALALSMTRWLRRLLF